jgi:hypothetical protein
MVTVPNAAARSEEFGVPIREFAAAAWELLAVAHDLSALDQKLPIPPGDWTALGTTLPVTGQMRHDSPPNFCDHLPIGWSARTGFSERQLASRDWSCVSLIWTVDQRVRRTQALFQEKIRREKFIQCRRPARGKSESHYSKSGS